MDLDIQDLRVLVTAGASGIGREIVHAFVREGARVHACDVDQAALAALAETGARVTATPADVADRDQVARLFEEALGQLGGLDVLVNNAGIAGPTARIEEIAPEDWDRTLAIDITGMFNCTRLAVPHLRKSANASIINISSAAGRFGFPLRTPYAAAKWAVVGFTKSLSAELGADRIRVNAILPGIVEGERIRRVFEAKAQQRGVPTETIEREAFANCSVQEFVTAQQIAAQIVFLCSPCGRSIDGQAIAIDNDIQKLA